MKTQLIAILVSLLFILNCVSPENSVQKNHSRNVEPPGYTRKEAPMLAKLVDAGKLPPLEARLPKNPAVVTPRERLGNYCDAWHLTGPGLSLLGGSLSRFGYISLVHWAMDWESFEPGLAEKYEILDGGRRFRFYLREGHKWSDGHPFTVDDIEFAIKHVLGNPKLHPNPPRYLRQDDVFAKFNRISDTAFEFSFPKPKGNFLIDMAAACEYMIYPRHYLSQFMPPFISVEKADSIAAENGYASWTQYFTATLQRGRQNPDLPSLRAWKRKTPRGEETLKWELERNPYYYVVDSAGRQLPYFDRIVGAVVTNIENINLNVVTGKIDFQIRYLESKFARFFLKNQEKGGYVVEFFPRRYPTGIFLNMQKKNDPVGRELLAQRPFRKALAMAVNRDEINKLLNWGTGRDLFTTIVAPRFQGDRELKDWFSFQPARANALLDSLGLEWGDEGIRLRPDGKKLILIVQANESLLTNYLELVREYWSQIGVKMNIRMKSHKSWWDATLAAEFDGSSYTLLLVPDQELIASASHVMPTFGGTYWGGEWGVWFRTNGRSGVKPPPEVRRLYTIYERICRTMDMNTQNKLIEELVYRSIKIGHTVTALAPHKRLYIRKKTFHNVSRGNYFYSWIRRAPAPDYPETFFME